MENKVTVTTTINGNFAEVDRYPRTARGFENIACICTQYAFEHTEDSDSTTSVYMMEVADAMNEYKIHPLLGWDKLVSSGIFHDAIGKLVGQTSDYIDVLTDY